MLRRVRLALLKCLGCPCSCPALKKADGTYPEYVSELIGVVTVNEPVVMVLGCCSNGSLDSMLRTRRLQKQDLDDDQKNGLLYQIAGWPLSLQLHVLSKSLHGNNDGLPSTA